MLIAIYHILKGEKFRDLGAAYYTRFNREKKINAHIKQLKTLGVSIPDDVLRRHLRRRELDSLGGNFRQVKAEKLDSLGGEIRQYKKPNPWYTESALAP
jgi:hypothetical protein